MTLNEIKKTLSNQALKAWEEYEESLTVSYDEEEKPLAKEAFIAGFLKYSENLTLDYLESMVSYWKENPNDCDKESGRSPEES